MMNLNKTAIQKLNYNIKLSLKSQDTIDFISKFIFLMQRSADQQISPSRHLRWNQY